MGIMRAPSAEKNALTHGRLRAPPVASLSALVSTLVTRWPIPWSARGLIRWAGGQRVVQFAAGADAELGEHLAQVPFDCAGGHEQLGADLGVGLAVAREPGDAGLLRSEGARILPRAFADGSSGGQEFAAGTLGEGLHADGVQHLVRGP